MKKSKESKQTDIKPKESKKISIKQLSLADIPAFARLRNEIEKDAEHLVISPGERTESAWRILARMLISARRLNTLVAEADGRFVGYVSLTFARFKKLRGNAYLTISLISPYRGMGIGTKLMKEAEKFAKERGIRRIELEVFSKNPSVKLYERLGYETEGRKSKAVYNGGGFDDIILMAKFI